jgi:hypothetical protein
VYCSWGKQTCAANGYWGVCSETSDRPAGCTAFLYDPNCCVAAGQCCQSMSDKSVDAAGHVVYASIGTCGGIATGCQ